MNNRIKIFLAVAAMTMAVGFPADVQAVSFTAGEAQAEEQSEEATEVKEDKSSDAALKSLDIQPGTLSPSFSPDVTEYTFTLEDNNMNQVLLTAKPNSKKAKVIAASGFTNLKIGENLAVLTVKAEDGTTRFYHVKITRQQGEVEAEMAEPAAAVSQEGYIATGQDNLVVHSSFEDELLPEGCTKVEYSYKGNYVEAAYFDAGELILLYASASDGSNGDFYVYYSGSNEFFEFVPLQSSNGRVVFPVQYPTGIPIPNYFTEASIDLNGKVIAGYCVSESLLQEEEYTDMVVEEEESPYTLPEITDYFLFFGISSDGNRGWYLYDTVENTCQRYLDLTTDTNENIFDEESYVVFKEKSQKRMVVICVLLFILLICIGIILNQFLKIRELKEEYEEDEEEEEEENEEEIEQENEEKNKEEEVIPTGPKRLNGKQKKKEKSPVKPKQEDKNIQKQEKKVQAKAQSQSKPEAKPVKKPQPKPEPKPVQKSQPKPEPKPVQKSQPKPEPKPVKKPQPKPEPKPQPQLPPELDDDFEFEFIDINR